jgi:hypothetical protein
MDVHGTKLARTLFTIAEPEEVGNGGRIQWVSGRLGEAPAYAGTDFIVARKRPDCRRLSLFRQATLNWTLLHDDPSRGDRQPEKAKI